MEIEGLKNRLRRFGFNTKLQQSPASKQFRVTVTTLDNSAVVTGKQEPSEEAAYCAVYHEAMKLYLHNAVISQSVPSSDDRIRLFHSRTQLTSHPIAVEKGATYVLTAPGVEVPADGLESEANFLIDALLDIPGVAVAEVHAYHAVVHKAVTYSWSEIDPKVIALLQAINLGDEGIDVVPEPENEVG